MNGRVNFRARRQTGFSERGLIVWTGGVGACLTLAAMLAAPAPAAAATQRVSVSSSEVEGNGLSIRSRLSADGRFVAFQSAATNLVSGDTNAKVDVFLRDRQTGTTQRVSVGAGGAQANNSSEVEGISANGRLVLFESNASNLVPGDTNSRGDVFLRDRQTGTTERVSVRQGGGQIGGVSFAAGMSADGRFIGFATKVANVVPGDTNGQNDMFVLDRQTGSVARVSLGQGGAQANALSIGIGLSGDGRFALFDSFATNLVSGPASGFEDAFVRDRQTGTTRRVCVSTQGSLANARCFGESLSADGRYVGFSTPASNMVPGDTLDTFDPFVRDLQTGTTEIVNVSTAGIRGNGESSSPELSADGRYVAFSSSATNLVPGDTNGRGDTFVRDRQTGITRRVGLGPAGAQPSEGSGSESISANGRFVSFNSDSLDLVTGDTNGNVDVFVRNLTP
jgi:Tol biopolymer transport system component